MKTKVIIRGKAKYFTPKLAEMLIEKGIAQEVKKPAKKKKNDN